MYFKKIYNIIDLCLFNVIVNLVFLFSNKNCVLKIYFVYGRLNKFCPNSNQPVLYEVWIEFNILLEIYYSIIGF